MVQRRGRRIQVGTALVPASESALILKRRSSNTSEHPLSSTRCGYWAGLARHMFTELPKAQSLAEVEALLPTRLDPAALARNSLKVLPRRTSIAPFAGRLRSRGIRSRRIAACGAEGRGGDPPACLRWPPVTGCGLRGERFRPYRRTGGRASVPTEDMRRIRRLPVVASQIEFGRRSLRRIVLSLCFACQHGPAFGFRLSRASRQLAAYSLDLLGDVR